jgi:hypothetical protein
MRPGYRKFAGLIAAVADSKVHEIILIEATDLEHAEKELGQAIPPQWKLIKVYKVHGS